MLIGEARQRLVLTFLEVGSSLEGLAPGSKPWFEDEMAHLVRLFHYELIAISQDPADDAERQLAIWLHNLASLPPRSTMRLQMKWLNIALSQLPRPKGRPVLEPARYAWVRRDLEPDPATVG
jgi:hypothetical protein